MTAYSKKESGRVARYQNWPKLHKLLKADEMYESPDKHKEYIEDETTTIETKGTAKSKVVNNKITDTAERLESNSTKTATEPEGS